MMQQPIFTGSCVALVTPFTENGVDFNKFEELIEYQIKEGTDAILVCGTTGEASTMPDSEHKAVIKFAVEKINGRVPVIAGTGSNDTSHAIALSKYAEEAGADAILTVTPYYNKTTQEGLYRHFKVIAESIKIPVILYNVPSRTNLNINVETIVRLAEIDNIRGIKECNFNQVGETILLCGDKLDVYSGEDGNAIPLMALGGKGLISVMANMIPKDTHDMVAAYINGDMEKARQMQLKTYPLLNALFCEVNPIPIKAAMNQMGMNVGECRLPLVEMSDNGVNKLKKAMADYGVL